jgi:hypothetical protein
METDSLFFSCVEQAPYRLFLPKWQDSVLFPHDMAKVQLLRTSFDFFVVKWSGSPGRFEGDAERPI